MKRNNSTEARNVINNHFEDFADLVADDHPGVDITPLLQTITQVRESLTLDAMLRESGMDLPEGKSVTAEISLAATAPTTPPLFLVDGGDLALPKSEVVNLVIDCDSPIDEEGCYRHGSATAYSIEITEEANADYATRMEEFSNRIPGREPMSQSAALQAATLTALARVEEVAGGEGSIETMGHAVANLHMLAVHGLCEMASVDVVAEKYKASRADRGVLMLVSISSGDQVSLSLHYLGKGLEDGVLESIFGEGA